MGNEVEGYVSKAEATKCFPEEKVLFLRCETVGKIYYEESVEPEPPLSSIPRMSFDK